MIDPKTWLRTHDDVRTLELMFPDTNGVLRGKRVARAEVDEIFRNGAKLPGASVWLDTQGDTLEGLRYGLGDGDPDVICRPVANTLSRVPWARTPTAQCLLALANVDGSPYFADSRHVLDRVVQQLASEGLRATVAVELEFYLIEEGDSGMPMPRTSMLPGTNLRQEGMQYAALDDLADIDDFLHDLTNTCEAQGIPATTAVPEFSPGQYEVNLHHRDNPVAACDDAVLLKRTVKALARKNDLAATFMAKPFEALAGSGMHIHVSLQDKKGRAVFAPTREGEHFSKALEHAVAGLQDTMADGMAIFVPNANGYRRVRPGFFVPVSPSWGMNHRQVALRVPLSDQDNTRIEHRVASADANPYLVMACVLTGLRRGLKANDDPTAMVQPGSSYDDSDCTLPIHWNRALDQFAASAVWPEALGAEFCRAFHQARSLEAAKFQAQISDRDYQWYLRAH